MIHLSLEDPLNFSKFNFSTFLEKNIKKWPYWDVQSFKRNKVMNFLKPSTDVVAMKDKLGQSGHIDPWSCEIGLRSKIEMSHLIIRYYNPDLGRSTNEK